MHGHLAAHRYVPAIIPDCSVRNVLRRRLLHSSALPEYKLITVLGILIDNAVEATPVENTIFLDIASQNNQCYIKIGNPGPMITSDFLHNIFLPGYTTKHAKNTGHGLGLPSLKSIVNNNNGNITLSNEKINNINYIIFEVTV